MIRVRSLPGGIPWRVLFGVVALCLLCLGSPTKADGLSDIPYPTVSIPLNADGFDLAPYLLYWQDEVATASFEDAFRLVKQGVFQPLPHATPNLGFRDGSVWFYLGLSNPFNYKRLVLIEVDYAILDKLEVYCFGPDQGPIYYPSGDHLQYDSRPLKVRNFVFPLALEALQSLQCLLRVDTETNILLPIRAYDNLSYIEESHVLERLLGGMYGIALALLIYNLIQYLLTRENLFFYFSMHVLGGLSYMTFMDGTLSSYWIKLELQDIGVPIAICLGIGSAALFSNEFLELKQSHPLLCRIADCFAYAVVLLFVFSLFSSLQMAHMLGAALTLALCSFFLFVGIKRLQDGFSPARVYLLGFGSVFVLVIWIVLNIFFLKSDVRWITYGINMVWMFELLVLSVAISVRIKSIKAEQVHMNERMRLIKNESHTKTEFLAKVSHEIRTPMNGMLGLIELIQATPLNKDQKRYISAIHNAGKGLLDVINDVLDFSRIEAGKMELTNELFQLQEILSDACSIYEFDARKKGLELGCIIAPGTPLSLLGDSIRIRQILLNTLSNALKYTDKGFVHINVQLTDQIHDDKLVLRFEVEDSGLGIAVEDQAKLFQSYSQVNRIQRMSRFSTGLGLSISQQLVHLMGGEMGVKSELGEGSCFWFDIPLAMPDDVDVADRPIVLDLFDGCLPDQSDLTAVPATSLSRSFTSHETAPRILVVEDNDINQSVMTEFLSKMDITPELADNGRAAVEMIQQQGREYNLILMDCEMPVMDGYEAAARIVRWQKAKGLQLTPIIALSAYTMEKHREMALESGMVDFLTKPVSSEQLFAKLARYLDLSVS